MRGISEQSYHPEEEIIYSCEHSKPLHPRMEYDPLLEAVYFLSVQPKLIPPLSNTLFPKKATLEKCSLYESLALVSTPLVLPLIPPYLFIPAMCGVRLMRRKSPPTIVG